MFSQEIKCIGRLSESVMFKGTKSERKCLVMHDENGCQYRINVIDKQDYEVIEYFAGDFARVIQIAGKLDNIRGHLRLSCRFEDIQIKEANEMPEREGGVG